ncbi:MAG: hypothetical protein MK105_02825 [Crocinitomicaceae bacterium]|nr:hypothetical protein [Crocinitomicaceae bacterium]
MELNKNLLEQKANFCNSRNTEMSDEEFAILLITFPAFRVANADNDFDEDERDLMANLLYNFLREIYGEELNEEQYENMIIAYLEDFLWTNEHAEWKNKLIDGLKVLCKDIEGLDETVKGMMKEMAEVSDGVSQEETDMIVAISDSL